MYDTSADMNWLPTRKKDNEYEELLSRRTNCSSRNNKKLQEQKKCEVRQQQHELHKTRNANYGSQSEVAWFAITCTWLSALVPSSYTRRELRVLRPVSTFTTSFFELDLKIYIPSLWPGKKKTKWLPLVQKRLQGFDEKHNDPLGFTSKYYRTWFWSSESQWKHCDP